MRCAKSTCNYDLRFCLRANKMHGIGSGGRSDARPLLARQRTIPRLMSTNRENPRPPHAMMRRRRAGSPETPTDRTPSATRHAPDDLDPLWRSVIEALSLDAHNPALRDPRFLRWLAEHAVSDGSDAPSTDEEWMARGQALRDAARQFLDRTSDSGTSP